MNRLKLLAAAALLAVPLINACEGDVKPPAMGSITGQVAIEGEQQAGVTVKLSNGATATTTSTGSFGFEKIEAGTYTLTISGFAEDASFDKTDASATIATDGQTVTANFNGSWIRTSAVMGAVTVEGTGLSGVVVKLTGMSEDETTTSTTGAYSFTGLRAGVYTVEISGFDEDDIGFSATSSVADVAVGETGELDFQASYLRASAVQGQVSVEGKGLAGVTVSLQGVDRNLEVGTNSGGQFNFTSLRKGEYSLVISGWDDDEYGFEVTSQTVTVDRGETADVPFDGIALRTAAVSGAVTIEGTGLEGVTVSLTGQGTDLSVVTNAAGQWKFTRLHAGSYAIGISGFDTDEYGFDETSASVTVELKETATVEFDGIKLRTAAISGQVSIEGDPLAGVTITVNGRDEEHTATTNAAGNYTISRLHAGDYTVTVSGFDTDEYDFDPTVKSVSVGLRETADIGFSGIMLRTVEIMGTVDADGDPLAGVTVTISGGRADEEVTATTDSEGGYSIDRLHAGDYTVAVSGFDADEYEFKPATQSIEVDLREKADVDFPGVKLRTVEIMGTVDTDGEPLGGVTVTISGGRADEEVTAVTDVEGAYSLDRLHAGDYKVAVSGFDADEYEFKPATQSITVDLREKADVDFPGVKLRTVEIFGTVAAEDEPLADVTVTVSGGRADEVKTTKTDAKGEYSLDRLHAGAYTVGISGYDTDEFEFDPDEQSITTELRKKFEVLFENGIPLRTASISGRVTLEGDAADGITITLSGEQEAEMETTTNGQYNFPGLPAGDYKLELSGYDAEEHEYTPKSVDVTLMLDEGKIQNFVGRSLRTVAITGAVTAEGEKIAGANVDLYRVVSLTEVRPVAVGIHKTDDDGEYALGGLLDDTYAVLISGYDDEYEFPKIPVGGQLFVAWVGYVATDDTATADFTGTIIRTAEISGEVTVDGNPMEDIEVTIAGDHAPDENTTMTDADGAYMFDGLRKGDYTVSIANPDDEMYDFGEPEDMESEINVAVGQKQDDVSFSGSIRAQGSISGQVHVDDYPIEDVAVTLSGDADRETTTDERGEYNFTGLAGGDYTVSIVNPDMDRYSFEVTEKDVDDLGSDEPRIVDFGGEHVLKASVSGTLFLDEVAKDGEWDAGEPVFGGPDHYKAAKMAKLVLEDQDGDMWRTTADSSGTYAFMGLKAGTYTLMHDTDSDGALSTAGYAFAGDTAGVSVTLTGTTKDTVDLPYEITKQTLKIGAVMANEDTTTTTAVAGVKFDVYPNLEAAQTRKDMLGSGTTPKTGSTAAVTFDRADDYGVDGKGTPSDGVVIVVVNAKSTHHADLQVLDPTGRFEAGFKFTERITDEAKSIKLVNTTSQFKWRVMSADREVGGTPLAGWNLSVSGGGSDIPKTVVTGKTGYAETGEDSISVDDIPRKYRIALDTKGQTWADSIGEDWKISGSLSYTHTGLNLPSDPADTVGTISVNWTTQSLYIGFYREVDGRPGFTDRWVGGGDVPLDHRPVGSHLRSSGTAGVSWMFRHEVDGRFEEFKWDHDDNSKTDDVDADKAAKWVNNKGNYWLVRFPRIPTGTKLEVTLEDIGDNKTHYSGPKVIDVFDVKASHVYNLDGVFNTFGADGGGHPEMWLCGESRDDIDPDNGHADCVTHGYQWTNNLVDGDFYSRTYSGHPYTRTALASPMKVTLEGVSAEANDDSTYTVKKGKYNYSWPDVNDGVYILKTEETDKYGLDSAGYSYSGRAFSKATKLDTAYLDTLYVFYQERSDGERPKGKYDRDTRFKITDQDPTLDAKLSALKVDNVTVPGFSSSKYTYKMTVGWDMDTVDISATPKDKYAKLSGDTGEVLLRKEGNSKTFTVTSIVKAAKKADTATYTIEIYRTTDRVRVTKTATGAVIDTVKVDEGDSTRVYMKLWARPTGETVVTYGSTAGNRTFTASATKYDTSFWVGAAEDNDGEDNDSTYTLTVTGTQAGTQTLEILLEDNDTKLFVSPTEMSAIEGASNISSGGNAGDYRTPVLTTLATEPTDAVDLVIGTTSGGDADQVTLEIAQTDWETAGASFNVVGDKDGKDFDVTVNGSGGGYDDVVYPTIDFNWIDSTDHKLVVQTQAANVMPGRANTTRVLLWRRNAVDDRSRTILDSHVVFDSLDLALGCPEEWSCTFGDGSQGDSVILNQDQYFVNVVVTPPDTVAKKDAKYAKKNTVYTVTFIAQESDATNDNGYFIGGAEKEYAIKFKLLADAALK